MLPRTVASWDLKCDMFIAYTEVEKDFMTLVIVTFEAAGGGSQNPDRKGMYKEMYYPMMKQRTMLNLNPRLQ